MGVEPMERATASTEKILANLSPDQLDLATPCQSWTVRDVINHIAGNGYWFEGIARDGVAPDRPDNAGPDVTGGDFLATFTDGSQRAIAAFGAKGVLDSTLNLPWGEMPAAAFLLMASTDQFVHGWDIAKATGQSTDLDAELAATCLEFYSAMPVDTFRGPDGEGMPFGDLVTVPASAGPLAQLLALLGRTP